MAWMWPWQKSASGAEPVTNITLLREHLADLRGEVAILRRLNEQLLAQLAERDAQIRLVLEERFYRPVVAAPPPVPPAREPEEFNDVTQFDGPSDETWLKNQTVFLMDFAARKSKESGSDGGEKES